LAGFVLRPACSICLPQPAARAIAQASIAPVLKPVLMGPAELRAALLSETVDALFAGARDEKLRRVIEFTYFRPAPKQEVTAQQLGLAFGTYRRHLTTALDRLARWLWDRERGSRA
jgi:hypothetical protein